MRALLEDLQRTRGLLRSQPVLRAPRNFTLTPQMAGVKTSRPASRRLAPAFGLVSVMAAALFMLVLVGDFLSVGRQPALFQVASRSASLPMEVEVQKEVEAPVALEAGAVEPAAELQGVTEAPPPAAPLAENAFAQTTPTPAPEATLQAPSLAEAYPPPGEELAKSAGTAQDVAATAALTEPPPTPQPTAVAQADELPVEEAVVEKPAEEETRAAQPAIQPRWETWRLAELGLGLIALVFGIIAYVLRRSRRV